jgi:hypothetical protein
MTLTAPVCFRRPRSRTRRVCRPVAGGYTLVEALVYISVLAVLIGISYAAFYRCFDSSLTLRRNVDDIGNALRAGETWRADVRASGEITFESSGAERILHLPGARGDIAYQFAGNSLLRRTGSSPWKPVLEHVKASSFAPDPRQRVTAWRWELELQTRPGKTPKVLPRFSFTAVPAGK